jgi:hypothetical protein
MHFDMGVPFLCYARGGGRAHQHKRQPVSDLLNVILVRIKSVIVSRVDMWVLHIPLQGMVMWHGDT